MEVDPIIDHAQASEVLPVEKTPEISAAPGVENLAGVWQACEALSSPDLEARWWGVKRLADFNAVRRFPLVAYLLTTRLTEPDIALRERVVQMLAGVLTGDSNEPLIPAVYHSLTSALASMRVRPIYALLQVALFNPMVEPMVAGLLSYCSYAGQHLAHILSDRDRAIEVRHQAVNFIGRLGFLDALPTLERLTARMELRMNGRNPSLDEYDEANLFLDMRQAIELLKAP